MRQKLDNNSTPLLELPSLISRGSSTGCDDVFMLRRKGRRLFTRDNLQIEIEEEILRTPLYATDFGRYSFHPEGEERVIFPYNVSEDGYSLIEEHALRTRFPHAFAYLSCRRRELKQRKQYAEWYSFSAPGNLNVHDKADLLRPSPCGQGAFLQTAQAEPGLPPNG